jgi:hypothetical protein
MTWLLPLLLLLPPDAVKPGAAAPAKAQLSDTQIEKDIRARLARSKMAADNFTVRVQGGIATWEGKTDVIQRKGAARSAGAKAVVNNIKVSEAARRQASAQLDKGARRAQVKRTEVPNRN